MGKNVAKLEKTFILMGLAATLFSPSFQNILQIGTPNVRTLIPAACQHCQLGAIESRVGGQNCNGIDGANMARIGGQWMGPIVGQPNFGILIYCNLEE
jgi:hypothetical protein